MTLATSRSWPGGSPGLPRAGGGGRSRSEGRGIGVAVLVCLAAAALSLLLPATTPTYDPWAWLVWGREVASLELDTRFGPSWKPLPVLFTTPFSLFGDAGPELWLVVARTGALLGLVAAFRLARRLGGPLAGALAVVMLALSGGYLRGSALGYSEGLLVALVLLAVERHLMGRRAQALLLGFAAGLLRPETWPFLGLYALYLFVREPRLRRLTPGLMAALPVLWLGPELWGSGDPLRAASRAQDPTLFSPAFAERPAVAILAKAQATVPWPAKVGAAIAAILAAWGVGKRRRRASAGGRSWSAAEGDRGKALVTLALAGAGAAWFLLVAFMTELGYAGNARYLAVPVALACVVGGIGLGWLAGALAAVLDRRAVGDPPGRPAVIGAAALIAIASAALLPRPLAVLTGDFREARAEAALHADLPAAIARVGGRERVLACGKPVATALEVPVVAWHLGVSTGRVDIVPRAPGMLFRGPPELQPPDAPAPALTAGGFRPLARVGRWTVSGACPPGASARR